MNGARSSRTHTEKVLEAHPHLDPATVQAMILAIRHSDG